MKKFTTAILALLITALSIMYLSGCVEKKPGVIRLSEVTHSIFYSPFYIAINKGYFTDEGIDIELTTAGGSNLVMTALTSGSADIGLLGPEASVYVTTAGKQDYPVIFGQLTKRDGSFLVGRTAEPNFSWKNLTNKRVLIGRKGGMPAMTFEYVMNNNGLVHDVNVNLDTTIEFVNMAPAFLSDNSIHYTTLFEPTASDIVAQGKGFIVAAVGAASGEVPYTVFSANKGYISDNPEIIKAFLRAVKRGYEYMTSNDSTIVAQALAPSFASFSLNMIKASVESYIEIDAWCSSPVMSESAFNRLQDVMQNAGQLPDRADYSKIVDNTYAKAVEGK